MSSPWDIGNYKTPGAPSHFPNEIPSTDSTQLRSWLDRHTNDRPGLGSAGSGTPDIESAYTRPSFSPGPPNHSQAITSPRGSNHNPTGPTLDIRTLTSTQIAIILERLCREVNWDWFDENISRFRTNGYLPSEYQKKWDTVRELYMRFVQGAPRGVHVLLLLPEHPENGSRLYFGQSMAGNAIGMFVGPGDENATIPRFFATVRALVSGGKHSTWLP